MFALRADEFTADHPIGLKLGDQGLYLRTSGDAPERLASIHEALADDTWRSRELITPCFVVDEVGTTGSGDATIAGLLSAYLRGEPPERAVKVAACCGWQNVQAPDAASGVRSWDETIEALSGEMSVIPQEFITEGWSWSETHGLWAGPGDPLHRS